MRAFSLGVALAVATACTTVAAGPSTTAVAFADLPGFADDDLAAAFQAFLLSCSAAAADVSPRRAAVPPPAALRDACADAGALKAPVDTEAARAFFERAFAPRRVDGSAFFTGYYEPVVEGSLVRTGTFATPLRALPAGAGPWPDRAAIDAGALDAAAPPLVWLREPVDAFFVQIQGSARVALPDGTLRRVAYAGRNGKPYTSIGKVLVERLHVPPAEMGMAQLRAWIHDHGQGPGDDGTKLMQLNRSYIFFRFDETLAPDAGPVGGEGISLTPTRSLAVDRAVWPYGLPIWIDTTLPSATDAVPFRRLLVAQDTGSGIVGAARGDIFFGTGSAAASRAGAMRQAGSFVVLWPKEHIGTSRR